MLHSHYSLHSLPSVSLPSSPLSTPSPQYHPIPSHLQLSPLPPFYFRPLSHPSLLHPLFSSPLTSPLHSFTSPRLASPPPFLLLFYSLPPSPLLPPSSLFSSLPSPIRHISTPPPFPSPPLLYLLPSIFLSYNPSFL